MRHLGLVLLLVCGLVLSTSAQQVKPVTIKKASNETVTNSTTLQNDDDCTFSALASTTYEITVMAIIEGAQAGDFKWAWSVPSGATGIHGGTRLGDGATGGNANVRMVVSETLTTALAGGTIGTGAGNRTLNRIFAYITTTDAGTITWQWAQNTSNATGTTVRASTRCTYRITDGTGQICCPQTG